MRVRILSKYVDQANLQEQSSWPPSYPLEWRFCLCLDKNKNVDTKKASTRGSFSFILVFEIH